MRTIASSGERACARAASSVPRIPEPRAMSRQEQVEATADIEQQHRLLAARRLAHLAAEGLEKAPHHPAHFGIVLDQQHHRGPAAPSQSDSASGGGAARSAGGRGR